MRFLKVMLVLALVFAFSAIAYAETQSVKVSGDITARGFMRGNYDLNKSDPNPAGGGESTDWATFLQSTAEIQIDADLTDNVSGVIRLVNQRVWGDGLYQSLGANQVTQTGIRDVSVANAVAPGNGGAFDVLVDLAYIELKEFLYSPLTLKIGRQDLWFGKGFIIGNSLSDPSNALFAPEYTAINSFDAVRATLDYDPWTIDAVYAKMSENMQRADDDINLFGINVGYIFDNYNAEAEAYWWFRQARNTGNAVAVMSTSVTNGVDNNDVHTWGLRGSFDPIEDWTIALEGAYQSGEFMGLANQINDRPRSAWALDAEIECRYWQDDFAWRPVVAAEYIFYSGQDNTGNRNTTSNGSYNGWDHMYRGKFDTAIREFQNVFYATTNAGMPSYTNQHQVIAKISVEPTDSLTVEALYANFWLDQSYATVSQVNNQNTNKYIGSEIDVNVTWDYTEDVTFGLLTGFFFPGDFYGNGQDDVASDCVATVALSF